MGTTCSGPSSQPLLFEESFSISNNWICFGKWILKWKKQGSFFYFHSFLYRIEFSWPKTSTIRQIGSKYFYISSRVIWLLIKHNFTAGLRKEQLTFVICCLKKLWQKNKFFLGTNFFLEQFLGHNFLCEFFTNINFPSLKSA
jgi:hypothetical protein